MSERAANIQVIDAHVTYKVFEDRSEGLKQLFASRRMQRRAREIHAVRGVSFEVYEGETLGIVGPNGSGKSSLLSAMTGLLPLADGEIRVRSRPALLGVSAALRPSLSGRRNIEIGGLALGLSVAEVRERTGDIIAFSGLRDFIDLPMRTYSSGMRARLNFAIATAATPSILLIDEALAVGDEEFQKRSQSRIDEIRGAAGSVVLVTHGLSEVEETCDRAIWLEKGVIRAEGDPAEVVGRYVAEQQPEALVSSARGQKGASRQVDPADIRRGRTAILHIGVATADDDRIQADLRTRRGELFRNRFIYPTFLAQADHRSFALVGSHDTARFFGHEDPEAWETWRTELRESLISATGAMEGDLVTSSVVFSLLPDAAACEQVAEFFAAAGFDHLRAVLFVRRQDEYAALAHLRQVARGRVEPFDLDEHLADEARYDYAATVRRWSGVADVEVRLHRDRDGLEDDVVRFARIAGIPEPEPAPLEPEAPFDAAHVGMLRALNRTLGPDADVDGFGWIQSRRSERAIPGLAIDDAKRLLHTFADSNAEVLARVPDDERIEDYFAPPTVDRSPEATFDIDDLMGFAAELSRHASVLGRRVRRLEQEA